MPRNHRLFILAAALVAILASVGTVIMGHAAPLESSLPIVACLISIAASTAIFGLVIFLPRVRSEASAPCQSLDPEPETPPVIAAAVDPLAAEDPLNNKPLMQLVEECVFLFEEVERLRPSLDPGAQDFADHLNCRLQEILERSGATIIAGDGTFDQRRHRQDAGEGIVSDGVPIAETLSPGFAVGRRVFRRARVTLAETPTIEKGPTS